MNKSRTITTVHLENVYLNTRSTTLINKLQLATFPSLHF